MMEIHNGRCEITISVSNFEEHLNKMSIFNKEIVDNIPVKPPRKRVSFHDDVTDINAESEEESIFENGISEKQPEEIDIHNHQTPKENGGHENQQLESNGVHHEQQSKENGMQVDQNLEDSDIEIPSEDDDEKDLMEELEGILNVSEKINFFKSAFADNRKNGIKSSLGHQSSIPEARLAFVTGMVESSLAGNNLRDVRAALVDSDVTTAIETGLPDQDGSRDSDGTTDHQVTSYADELGPLETQSVNEMAPTQVTFMKIFASPKAKNAVETAVDSSSILEHREEIRELWEKRMMADDNQSSPSSITIETKPALEEGKEEVVTTVTSESETKSEAKLPNGSAKTIENNNAEDTNANHIHPEEAKKKEEDDHATVQNGETDHDNNCADSLEEDNVEDYVEEKTYTSETSLVMKSESVHEVKIEEIVQTTTVEEPTSEEVPENKIAEVEIPTSEDVAQDSIDGISTVEETVESSNSSVEQVSVTESKEVSEKVNVDESKTIENIENVAPVSPKVEYLHEEQSRESLDNKGIKALEIPDCTDEDGFVRIEECLPIGDNLEDIHDVLSESTEREGFGDEHKNGFANGHEELPSSPSLPPTPDSALGDKIDLEQSIKGLNKRAHVNKTEQPYSSCTTETKIAMEIREMREREEELRIMRERSLTSPQPPKSPVPKEVQGPSPTPSKEQAQSPLPNGCGYRVSSVFGHKGTTSPSPSVVVEEERKAVFGKGFAKESPVEKEIRIARDREEELRKQKGLPPREDDSYVKPSQVKSSQVRVFGPVVGANNVKQAATAKIQLEIEEQTQREMALRDTGSIQTISQERTDAKVAKLKTAEVTKTAPMNGQNGNSHPTNGSYNNGSSSPDAAPYKRGSPSPNGGVNVSRPASIFSQTNGTKNNGGISMHKFISSKGKEATFAAPVRNGGAPFVKEEPRGVVPPNMIKLKRTVSVESKIQQEIMEMKQREEELKLLHMNRSNDNLNDQDIMEHEINQKSNFVDYENGVNDEDLSPRHNKLIAQWEQRIQKAES